MWRIVRWQCITRRLLNANNNVHVLDFNFFFFGVQKPENEFPNLSELIIVTIQDFVSKFQNKVWIEKSSYVCVVNCQKIFALQDKLGWW